MKRLLNLFAAVLLFSIPTVSESKTIAYSPSITGLPLIFHFSSMPLSQFSAVTWVQMQNALLIQSSYSNHLEGLSYKKCCGGWNLWTEGMGQWLHQNTDAHEQFGYRNFTGGFSLGADKCYKNFLVGATFSYTNSSLDWDQSAGDAHINSYYGGLYGGWNNDCVYVNGSFLGAYNDYHTRRNVPTRTTIRHANANHTGWELLASVESGATLKNLFCSTDLVPFGSLDYVFLDQQSYREENARSANLQVKSRDDQLLQSQAGIQFRRRFFHGGWIIAPNVSFSYINQTPLTTRSYDVTILSLSHTFNVDGWSFERNLGAVALGLNFVDCNGMSSFTLRYDGQYGGNYWTQTGSLRVNLRF
jgi:outer membrane autotransporter protein